MNYYYKPTLVKFDASWVTGESKDSCLYGIAYKDEIICFCCGGVFEIGEVDIKGEDEWEALTRIVFGTIYTKKEPIQEGDRRMKAFNILWDVDREEDLYILPDEIIVPNDISDLDEISDFLTDCTGFCHKGFEVADI